LLSVLERKNRTGQVGTLRGDTPEGQTGRPDVSKSAEPAGPTSRLKEKHLDHRTDEQGQTDSAVMINGVK